MGLLIEPLLLPLNLPILQLAHFSFNVEAFLVFHHIEHRVHAREALVMLEAVAVDALLHESCLLVQFEYACQLDPVDADRRHGRLATV